MCQEVHDEKMPLMDCLAKISFARLAAEKDPAVGAFSNPFILTRGHPIRFISNEGWAYLKSKVPHIQAPKGLEFKDSFFEL
jgi:hypothetical protein